MATYAEAERQKALNLPNPRILQPIYTAYGCSRVRKDSASENCRDPRCERCFKSDVIPAAPFSGMGLPDHLENHDRGRDVWDWTDHSD